MSAPHFPSLTPPPPPGADSERVKDITLVASVFRFLRLVKLFRQAAKISQAMQGSRYRKDGFNLDLTYITPQCIAMSLPAVGVEANFRNPIEEVGHRLKP